MSKKIVFVLTLIMGNMFLHSVSAQKDNTLSAAEKKEGWKLLFDGKTTNGWRMYQNKPADCWGVKNEEIYCKEIEKDKTKNAQRADLITKDQYENYELLIDWKIAAAGNSGIIYNATEDKGASFESGPEYQLIDDEGYPGKLEDWQKTGANYAMYPPASTPTKPIGEYNTTKIVVKGTHREHWLNGVKIVEYETGTADWKQRKEISKWKDLPAYDMAKKGYICLQDHGGGVWFKNIKIRKLNP